MPSPTALTVAPLLLLGIVASAVPVLDRLRRAGRSASPWHWLALGTAVVVLAGIWIAPVDTLSQHYLLTAHLGQVLALMGVVPPLLLLALAPALPRQWWSPLCRTGHSLTHPGVAIVLVNAVFFLTHYSAAFEFGLTHSWFLDLSELALLGASVAFWWPIVSPDRRRSVLSPLGKLGYILLATIPQTFAGLLLAVDPHVIYTTYAMAPRLFGLSAHTDQQIAGACLAVLSKVALFTAFSIIFVRVLSPGPDSDDGGGGGGGPRIEPAPSPPGEPAWYQRLQSGPLRPEPAPLGPRPPSPVPVGSATSASER